MRLVLWFFGIFYLSSILPPWDAGLVTPVVLLLYGLIGGPAAAIYDSRAQKRAERLDEMLAEWASVREWVEKQRAGIAPAPR